MDTVGHTPDQLWKTAENSKKEFNRTVRSSSRVQRQVEFQLRESVCLVGPARSVGPVGPRGIQGTTSA
jgi:hypothetical protein